MIMIMIIPNRTFLVLFSSISGEFGHHFGQTQSSQNTHGETTGAWYVAEAYDKVFTEPKFSPKFSVIVGYQVSDPLS